MRAKKENEHEGSDRARCFFIGVEETLPGNTTTTTRFFFFFNEKIYTHGFGARGELLLPYVEEKKKTREDGSTTNNNSRGGK